VHTHAEHCTSFNVTIIQIKLHPAVNITVVQIIRITPTSFSALDTTAGCEQQGGGLFGWQIASSSWHTPQPPPVLLQRFHRSLFKLCDPDLKD
jgi:hypothetical protein